MAQEGLAGKTVLITGGTSGIGLAAASLFLSSGAQVVVNGRNAERAAQARRDLSAFESRLHFVQGDVSRYDDCRTIIQHASSYSGCLDIVINCAGVYQEKLLAEMTETDLQEVIDTNLAGTYWICHFALPVLRAGAGGAIVNIASDAGLRGNLLCTAYCAAKGGVIAFTKALALELAPYGIRANCVCPGDVDTPLLEQQFAATANPRQKRADTTDLYPLGRIAAADEVARVIAFLSSPSASFVTCAVWTVDGGLTAC